MVAYDRKSDGMYPLLTNDRSLSAREAFAAHRRQPAIEKRFQQLKCVFELTPSRPDSSYGQTQFLLPALDRADGLPKVRSDFLPAIQAGNTGVLRWIRRALGHCVKTYGERSSAEGQ